MFQQQNGVVKVIPEADMFEYFYANMLLLYFCTVKYNMVVFSGYLLLYVLCNCNYKILKLSMQYIY